MIALLLIIAGCDGPPSGSTRPASTAPTEVREWVSIASRPCAQDSTGRIQCWSSSEWILDHAVGPLPDRSFHSFFTDARGPHLLGALEAPGTPVQILDCANPGGISCQPPPDPVIWARDHAALTSDGTVLLWGNEDPRSFPRDRSWHAVSRAGSFSAVDEDNVLALLLFSSFLEFPLDPGLDIVATVSDRQMLPGGLYSWAGACALDAAGTITCVGDGPVGSSVFAHPPYRFIDGGRGFMCAVRSDDLIECNDGTLFDLGAIRAFAAFAWEVENPDTGIFEFTPGFCVITTGNEIRCEGLHYPDDLKQQLADLPR